jgi:transcriptional regulator with XRE-family HTH domain
MPLSMKSDFMAPGFAACRLDSMQTVGELLRQWRQRRQLSQLDLALGANVSARHVSLIETGKSNPSADMVLRLAAQLDIPLRDRNQLLLAAGFAPRYSERAFDKNVRSLARDAIARVLRAHEPYPALVIDRRWNIVQTNHATAPFFAGADPVLLRPPVNLVRLALHPRGLAPRLRNLTDVRTMLRSRIMRQLATSPDAELTKLYEELLMPSAHDSPSLASEADLVLPMICRLDSGQEIRLFSTTTSFSAAMDITLAEIAIELYYPADDASAAYFAQAANP